MPGLRARPARPTRPLPRRLLVLLLAWSSLAAAAPPAEAHALPEQPMDTVVAAVAGPLRVEPVEAPSSLAWGRANLFVVRVANAQDVPVTVRYDVVQLAEASAVQGGASWSPVAAAPEFSIVRGAADDVTYLRTAPAAVPPWPVLRSNFSVQGALLEAPAPTFLALREHQGSPSAVGLASFDVPDDLRERPRALFEYRADLQEEAVVQRTTFELAPQGSWLVAFDIALLDPHPAMRDLRFGLRLHLPGGAAQIAPLREVPVEAAPGPTAPLESLTALPLPFLALCATSTSSCLPLRRRGEGRPPGLRDEGDDGGGTAGHGEGQAARWLFLPFLGLYTRLGKSELLQQATRDRVYRRLVEQPGTHLAALRRDTGLATGVLLHHLRMLERHQFVVSRREGDRRCYYPTGTPLPQPAEVAAPSPEQRVLQALGAGWMSQREVAERLGMTQQGASYHLVRLRRRGQALADRSTGLWKYRAAGS